MPNPSSRLLLSVMAALAMSLAAVEASATYLVEAGSSGTNKVMDGWCSLPEAIEAVNMDKTAPGATHIDCVNSGGGNDIMLEGVSSARYKTFGAVIRKSMSIYSFEIDGPAIVENDGAHTLRMEGTEPDGMGGTRPIQVYLFQLKLRRTPGAAGRGRVLDNRASLYLLEVTVSGGNVQGNTGQAGDGGGILSTGTGTQMTIQNSNITGNAATRGGGIFTSSIDGTALYEVTVDSNTASQQGGGIYSAGRLYMQRTTISTNSATGNGGGIFAAVATNAYCEMYFATIGRNRAALGGGVFIAGISVNTVTNGSIVGSNTRTNNTTLDDYSGHPNREEGEINTEGVRNLFRSGTGLLSRAPLDIVGSDPRLGTLTFFGGSLTRTHPLLAGSPARDVALVGTVGNDGFDQNYNNRPDPGADLGAFEVQ